MNETKSTAAKLFLWEGGALYIGPLSDNTDHRHHAAQICLGLDGPFRLHLDGAWHEATFAAIPPGCSHRFDGGAGRQMVALIDGESAAAQRLAGAEPVIGPAPQGAMPKLPDSIDEARALLAWLTAPLGERMDAPAPRDPRFAKVLNHIATPQAERFTAGQLAELAGLSESRFLHLFTENVGLPLRRYLLWRRIMAGIDAALAGEDLTAAAHLAGFSDSAHFSRTFRETFGLAPSALFGHSRNVQAITGHLP